MTDLKHYIVTSPEYWYKEVVLDDGSGPMLPTADYAEVDADSRREAVRLATAEWMSERDSWPKRQRAEGCCPFTGVKAQTEDELKAATHDAGPPNDEPEWCWRCNDNARRCGAVWTWVDDSVEWGWFERCGEVS